MGAHIPASQADQKAIPFSDAISRQQYDENPNSKSSALQLSIVICTHNRSASLSRLLRSLAPEVSPNSKEIEIIVVANACSDDTAEQVDGFSTTLPIRMLNEPVPGLSRARNTALSSTQADAILWLDDDTEVAPGFINAYLQALADHPEASFFAGKIAPAFEGTPPNWVHFVVKAFPSTYSLMNVGDHKRALDLDAGEFPFGANMLLRRRALAHFRFREDLGRTHDAGNLVGGEETHLFQTLAKNGHTGVWVPGATVRHWMPESRQTFRYFAAYHYAVGKLGIRLLGQNTTPLGWSLFPQYLMLIGAGRLLRRPDIWVPALTKLQRERGRMAESRARRKPR